MPLPQGRGSTAPRVPLWTYDFSSGKRKAQGGYPAPSEGPSWEVLLCLVPHSSLGESAGLGHWRSGRNRDVERGSLQQPTLISWLTIFLLAAATEQRSQPRALPICRTKSVSPIWPRSSVEYKLCWPWSLFYDPTVAGERKKLMSCPTTDYSF